MWAWLKKLFGFGISKDSLFLIKKTIRVVTYAVLRNNPQFVVPVSAAMLAIDVLVKRKEPAAIIQAAIDNALAELAAKVTTDPLIVAEIKDLKNLITIELEPLPEIEKLKKLQEIIDAFQVGLEAAKK